ncbi:hypothetical protein FALBO_791 [Fusarium albosuccineum]|uniref:Uncharacterized protein n=1 Tax=Fusarium albosuccineum TaxID=1237068 RepID=A0A8H4PIU9_9HYPO|nr:hypothetical protein FALBO_791 [Fusarium albosuccineum]
MARKKPKTGADSKKRTGGRNKHRGSTRFEDHNSPKDPENLKSTSKMAREAVVNPTCRNPASSGTIKRYGAVASSERLMAEGLHPDVTDKSLNEEALDWGLKARFDVETRDVTRSEYLEGNGKVLIGKYVDSGILIQGFNPSVKPDLARVSRLLEVMAGLEPYGQVVGEHMASNGIRDLEAFASAFPDRWMTLSSGLAVWDTIARKFRNPPSGGGVFVAVTPELSRGEYNNDPEIPSQWGKEAKALAVIRIVEMFSDCGPEAPFWGKREAERARDPSLPRRVFTLNGAAELYTSMYGEQLVKMVRSLPHLEAFEETVEAVAEPLDHQPHHHLTQVTLCDTMQLLITLHNRQNVITVLHFHQTALLDRRLVAVILRDLPNVKMLGIYECPLIHVGDVLCLLDLINEVNKNRPKGEVRLGSFDFYPRYHSGMPYKKGPSNTSSTYGLTWSHEKPDVVQRGLLSIVMQAVLKSRHMKIGMLMDKKGAFLKFLSQLPFQPLQILSFLDGLYRYLDLVEAGSKAGDALKMALYDMLKAVRLGLESFDRDWPKYYCQSMGKNKLFCSSCGCDFLQEFFSLDARGTRPHRRVCAACTLRLWLDEEKDHGKADSKELLDIFFPEWTKSDFNDDAPFDKHGEGLVRLQTKQNIRPPPPTMQVAADGTLYQPSYTEPLVRDNKLHHDSLQKLVTLPQFIGYKYTDDLRFRAQRTDMTRIVALVLKECYPEEKMGLEPFASARVDGGSPNHFDESQTPSRVGFHHLDYGTSAAAFSKPSKPREFCKPQLNTAASRAASTLPHNGFPRAHPFAGGEIYASHECPRRFCDPGDLVNGRRALRRAHLAHAQHQLDAADSRHEGSQLGQEAMRALQGEEACSFVAHGLSDGKPASDTTDIFTSSARRILDTSSDKAKTG